MVRGSLPLTLMLFSALQNNFSFVKAGWITGVIIMVISVIAALFTEETFGKELNYVEE